MDRVGPYEIIDVIGEGGMGTVYRGRDPRFNRFVAVKVLFEYLARSPEVLERFKNEAIIEARLQHPNVVTVYDFLVEDGVAAMVMELVAGEALDDFVKAAGGRLAPETCLEIFEQVLGALSAAHAQGLVHRDIKPSNIMVGSAGRRLQVKVMDFGVAKILGEEKHRTATNAKMGTIAYCSPEQLRSPRDVDHRSDVYSLGCTLYQVVTGAVPFDADTEYELMKRVVSADPLPPSVLAPELIPGVDSVVLRALAKEPSRRYQSCDDFLDALVELWRPSAAPPVPLPVPEPVAEWIAAPPALPSAGTWSTRLGVGRLAALGAIGLLVAALAFAAGRSRETGPKRAAEPPQALGPTVRPQAAAGSIAVRIEPPARASLDGWQEPDGGQRESNSHRFSGLKVRSYELRVWREGYREQTRRVVVRAGESTALDVRLDAW